MRSDQGSLDLILVEVCDVITQEVDSRYIGCRHDRYTPTRWINLWMFEWNPAKSNEDIFSNVVMGNSPMSFAVDFTNNELGTDLMRTMWQTVPYFQKAQEAAVNLEDWLAKENPAILWQRKFYRSLGWFSQPLVEMRKAIEGNVTAPDVLVKEFVVKLENAENSVKRAIFPVKLTAKLPTITHFLAT